MSTCVRRAKSRRASWQGRLYKGWRTRTEFKLQKKKSASKKQLQGEETVTPPAEPQDTLMQAPTSTTQPRDTSTLVWKQIQCWVFVRRARCANRAICCTIDSARRPKRRLCGTAISGTTCSKVYGKGGADAIGKRAFSQQLFRRTFRWKRRLFAMLISDCWQRKLSSIEDAVTRATKTRN